MSPLHQTARTKLSRTTRTRTHANTARVLRVMRSFAPICALAPAASAQSSSAHTIWTHFAKHEARVGLTDTSGEVPLSLASPLWVASHDDLGNAITLSGQSGPVADRDAVYALGRSASVSRLYAFRRADGLCLWSTPVPNPVTDSWSTPAIDERNDTIIVGAGNTLRAIDRRSGTLRWSTTLPRTIVNASPLVAPTIPTRIFITDADGFGLSGSLHCINADPHHSTSNPYTPGQLLWSAPIGGTAGNTPTYHTGKVLVASIGEFGFSAGSIYAFNAAATTTPTPLWIFENILPFGFFGGIAIHDGATPPHAPHAIAASYAFDGGQLAANLVKINLDTGDLVWSVPSNRTDATPIPLADGRILLSAGLGGFGSSPSVQLFEDHGPSATLLWDSALATWIDHNTNGIREPGEYLSIGGWTHQPAIAHTNTSTTLIVGTLPSGTSTAPANTHLRLINLNLAPTAPGFVASTFTGAGSTPALVGSTIYTIGASGLHAFGPDCDVNADGLIDIEDLYALESSIGGGGGTGGGYDVDRNGVINAADRDALIRELRRDERRDMEGRRR